MSWNPFKKKKAVQEKTEITWKTGILPTGDCFIHFSNGAQHFECTLEASTAVEMGSALLSDGKLRLSGYLPLDQSASPSLIPMKPKGETN